MREFKVNEYITLSMENNGIVIYITTTKHWAFRMIPFSKKDLSHEEEFLEVCLNFKEWSEKGYDLDTLDPYIAFDLLRWLFKAGDQLAKKAFEVNLADKSFLSQIER